MTLTDDRQPPSRPMPAGGPGAAPGAAGTADPADSPTSVFPAQSAPKPRWEQCDRCQSPVDPAQRYCVTCGTSQRRADDPAARYFAAARRRRIGVAAPVAVASGGGRTVSTTVAALLIALLPVAAGIGIVVGRGSADSGDQIIEALKASQGTRGAFVSGGAADGTVVDAAATTDDAAAADDTKAKKKGKEVDGVETQEEQAPILSSGPAGSARKLEDNKPTAKDIQESKKAVEQINARKGKEYIDTQRDLPDTIVIP